MKTYRILKTFPGSQTGTDHQVFLAGTEDRLSEALANLALTEGWVEEITEPAEEREAKVVAPAETKPAKPLKRK